MSGQDTDRLAEALGALDAESEELSAAIVEHELLLADLTGMRNKIQAMARHLVALGIDGLDGE